MPRQARPRLVRTNLAKPSPTTEFISHPLL